VFAAFVTETPAKQLCMGLTRKTLIDWHPRHKFASGFLAIDLETGVTVDVAN
jgi:hypothetical protein